MNRTERPFKDRQLWPRIGLVGQPLLILAVVSAGCIMRYGMPVVAPPATPPAQVNAEAVPPPVFPDSGRVHMRKEMLNALMVDDVTQVECSLSGEDDPDWIDEEGSTALHYARSAAMVRLLISYDADVNARDNDGFTVLMSAATRNIAASVSDLLVHGANVDAKDNEGKTALDYAKEEPANPEIVRLLQQAEQNKHRKTSE